MIPRLGCVAGVELGSTKICAVVAAARSGRPDTDPVEILGLGVTRSSGMSGSAVTNLEAATRSVRKAMAQAEAMAGREVETVFASIPGASVKASQSKGVVPVCGAEITAAHVRRVQEVGRTVPIPPGHELLHTMCQEYVVDGREGVQDPVGMTATRLESDMCIVTADRATCGDLSKVVDGAGYLPEELVMAPLASSLAVLDNSERESGVILVEVGGAHTDVLVFGRHRILHAASLPWGGASVTRDIARGLGVHEEEAGRIKQEYGAARRADVEPAAMVEVPGPSREGVRRVSRELLAHIIEQRLDEILGLVHTEVGRAGLLDRAGGVVLTGGGVSLVGTDELAKSVFDLPVRVGVPELRITGMTEGIALPSYATAVGLALYGVARTPAGMLAGTGRAIARVGGWLRAFF